MPIVAITGATGFVGRQVLELLLRKQYRVKALVRAGSHGKALQSELINWIEGELGNAKSEAALTAGADIVIHMAGVVSARSKGAYFKVNSDAVASLTKAANAAGVKRFVFLSSLAAMQSQLSDYAASKRAGEGRFARNIGTMKAVVVRAPAVFGTGDKATAPFYKMIRKGILPAPGGRGWKNRKLSLIHVNDLAKYLVDTCITGHYDGRTVTMATRASITWPEFAKVCANAQGKPVKAMPIPLFLLYPVAAMTSATKRVAGVGHLTLGKLREFLYEDWSIDAHLETGTDLQSALYDTIQEQ